MNRSKKGFTLVEIMIVVVIIGLLAAMAIPAFQKVRRSSIQKTIENDARQVASAAQQYMLEFGVTQVTSANIVGDGKYVKSLSKALTLQATLDMDTDFTMSHPQFTGGSFVFDSEGKVKSVP